MEILAKICVLILVIIAPVQAVMLTVGVLVIIDVVTGVWAAFKRSELIKSAILRRTVSKMIIYQIAIISGFLIQQYVLQNEVPITKVVAGFISLVELKSILENSNTILGRDIFKTLIKKLGSKNDKF